MKKRNYFLTIFIVLLLLATCFIAIGCKNNDEKAMESDDSSGQSKKFFIKYSPPLFLELLHQTYSCGILSSMRDPEWDRL